VWIIDIETRSAMDFKSADQCITIDDHGSLDADTVLPGFTLSLSELFAELDRHG
jgi:hypothetical protein